MAGLALAALGRKSSEAAALFAKASRSAVEALQHGLMGHLTEAQQKDAAAQVDAAVADMIANYKLEPEADASLHGLLAPLVAGAGAVREGRFGQPELAALLEVERHVAEAGWDQPAQE